ncbi:MAG: PorV/PorQ family protein, partial [Rhodothermales bacterium]
LNRLDMHRAFLLILLGLLLLTGAPDARAQDMQKLAQTGFKFLSVSSDPRAAAMGDAVTALEGFNSSLFYNPAGMARQSAFMGVYAGQTQWIAGIDHNHASVTFSPLNGRYGVFGFTMQSVSYGEIQETVRWDNDQGFRDLGTISPTALAVGIGYARAITDRFSVGGHVKYASQDLGESAMSAGDIDGDFARQGNREDVLAFDFGVLYQTGFRSLNLAMAIRNFSQEIQYEDESFQLPLVFHIGLAMDMIDLTNADPRMHSAILSIDAERPRDYSEMLNFGLEYGFMRTIMLRGGYAFLVEPGVRENDEQGFSLGAGVRQSVGGVGFGADYAYTDFGIFSEVHRIALHLSF